MTRIKAEASAALAVSPAAAYSVIADYRRGHPLIVPEPYFSDLQVQRGGVGAGTEISFRMRTFGVTRTLQASITEPEPGRRLVETYADGSQTTFLVEPAAATAGQARVTITTEYDRPGVQGWVEARLVPSLLRRVYAAELANLERVARTWPEGGDPSRV